MATSSTTWERRRARWAAFKRGDILETTTSGLVQWTKSATSREEREERIRVSLEILSKKKATA